MTQSPAGWYPDPYGTPLLRWWDGSQWTDATHRLETPVAQGAQPGSQAGAEARGDASTGTAGSVTEAAATGTSDAAKDGTKDGARDGARDAAPDVRSAAAAPTAATEQWAIPGGTARRGDTAQLPAPDLPPPQGRGGGMTRWVMGGVAVAVVAVLAIIGTIYLTSGADRSPADEGIAASSPAASAAPSPPPSTDPSAPPGTGGFPQPVNGRVTDSRSGLSYSFPGAPWQIADPAQVNPGLLGQQWTSGYQAVSQEDYEPGGEDWVGTVLAGPLAAGAPYDGPQSARDVLAAFLINTESVLYEPPHERRILEDRAITVGGRPGHLLKFEMDFTEQSRINGWKWRTEVGALVLVDRGEDRPPALLFATVPDNLDVRVVDQVIDSLQLA